MCRAGNSGTPYADAHPKIHLDTQADEHGNAGRDCRRVAFKPSQRDGKHSDNFANAGSEQHADTVPNSVRYAAGTGRLRGDLATGLLCTDD